MSYFNKDYGLINLDALAAYYNNVLGSTFVVKANCLATPIEGDKTSCTLQISRVPFAISDVRSETLTATLNFRVVWFPEDKRKKILEEMKRLLGYQRFVITEQMCIVNKDTMQEQQVNKTFNCTSFLEMQAPVGYPEIDCGKKVLDMQITGTILCTDADGGAIMSNDVVSFAKLSENDSPVPLPIIYQSSNDGFNVELHSVTGSEAQCPVSVTAENKQTIQALYLNRTFDKELIIGVKNKEKKQIIIEEVFDTDMTVKRKYNVLSVSTSKQAGAYMQYTMELQEYEAIGD